MLMGTINTLKVMGSGNADDVAKAAYSNVANCLGVAPEQVALHTRLAEDLGVDSIDRLALALELEEEFDVAISDNALSQMRTIGDAILCAVAAVKSRRLNRGTIESDVDNGVTCVEQTPQFPALSAVLASIN